MRKPLEDWVLRILLLHWGSGSFDVRPCDVGQNREEGNSLNISFGFMIVLGLTWPGKRVTGITYFLEFIPA
jgi:hypothetical protein